jgi:4-diphosphocytidyl-2-C-methyl-D-erythritol kinase
VFKGFAERAGASQRKSVSPIDNFVQGLSEVSSLRNDLEPAAIDVSPDLGRVAREVRRVGRATGATTVAMSGSGSSFFLLFKAARQRVAAAGLLEKSRIETLPCAFVSRRAFRERFEIPRPLSKRR